MKKIKDGLVKFLSMLLIFSLIMPFTVSYADVVDIDQIISDTKSIHSDDNTVHINECVLSFVSGGEKKEIDGKDSYIWMSNSDRDGHRFVFRVRYSFSGEGSADAGQGDLEEGSKEGCIQPGQFNIKLPKHIIKNRLDDFADDYEISIISREEYDDEIHTTGKNPKDVEIVYYEKEEDEDNFYITNVVELEGGTNGYFEIAYYTKQKTINYQDLKISDELFATVSIDNEEVESNRMTVGIDNTAYITNASVKEPNIQSGWNPSWGEAPENADDYYFLEWNTSGSVFASQEYTYSGDRKVSSPNGPVEIVQYELNGKIFKPTDENQFVNRMRIEGQIYDKVITKHKKSDFDKLEKYSITLEILDKVHPEDGIDADTEASARHTFYWTKPKFIAPLGHFEVQKYGNETYGKATGFYRDKYDQYDGEFSRYDLERIQNDGNVPESEKADSLGSLDYNLYSNGYPFPWTLDGDKNEVSSYGQRQVYWEIVDDTLYPEDPANPRFGDRDFGNYTEEEKNGALAAEDYDIEFIKFEGRMEDVVRDDNNRPIKDDITENFIIKKHEFTNQDVLSLSIKTGDTWIEKVATLSLKDGSGKIHNDSHIEGIKDYKVSFKQGVDGYKINFNNNYYSNALAIFPSVKIFTTDRIKEWVGGWNGKEPKEMVILKNVGSLVIKDDQGNQIYGASRIIGDRMRRTQKESNIKKRVSSTYNNKKKKRYEISWVVDMKEFFVTGEGMSQAIEQDGGIFYDLLPSGSIYKQNSVYIRDKDGEIPKTQYKVDIITNYKDSGRDLLKVDINKPGKNYSIMYTTLHSWSTLNDLGKDIVNPVAYETGNLSIAEGFKDDGGNLSDKAKDFMVDLSDEDTNEKKFIYSEAPHNIVALTHAISGLSKVVKSEEDNSYSSETFINAGDNYLYRLRFMNSFMNRSKNIILYDTLENYDLTHKSVKKQSDWLGSLKGINTIQLKNMGVAPVIYVSEVERLDFDNEDNFGTENTEVTNLENRKIWKKLDDSTDLSKVRAIAIDCRKAKDGKDFVLDKGKSLQAVLYMQAPFKDPFGDKDEKRLPITYNNIYLKDTIIDNYNNEEDFFIHQDFTAVSFKMTLPEFKLYKVSSEDVEERIEGVEFRLFGVSDYGTSVDIKKTSDWDGVVRFKDIEKGEYILQECSTKPGWFLNTTRFKVKVNHEGKLFIDGKENKELAFTVENVPRIAGDLMFNKVNSVNNDIKLDNVLFKLSGKSYYGNDILKTAISRGNGKVKIEDIERGEYVLEEVKTIDGYIKLKEKFKVVIDQKGLATILNEQGEIVKRDDSLNFLIENEPLHKIEFYKFSSFDNRTVHGAEFEIKGISDYGTKVEQKAVSTKEGLVEFTRLEPGIYTIKETKAPVGYDKLQGEFKVCIYKDGKYEIKGMSKDYELGGKYYYKVYNNKQKDNKIFVKKKWIDTEEHNFDDIDITIGTNVEQMKNDGMVWTFNGNGAKFKENTDNPDQNKVVFTGKFGIKNGEIKYPHTGDPKERYIEIWEYTDEEGDKKEVVQYYGNYEEKDILKGQKTIEELIEELQTKHPNGIGREQWDKYSYDFKRKEKLCGISNNLDFIKSAIEESGVDKGDILHIKFDNIQNFGYENINPEIKNYNKYLNGTVYSKVNKDEKTIYIIASGCDKTAVRRTTFNYLKEYFKKPFSYDISIQSIIGDKVKINESETSIRNFLIGYNDLKDIPFLEHLDVSNIEEMSGVFKSCSRLKNIEALKDWDTSKVRDMSEMFAGCSRLKNIEALKDWDTSKVTDMINMFQNCPAIKPDWYNEN